jgi:nitrogen fixation/metabolism regulation signal transduction histidine kinase
MALVHEMLYKSKDMTNINLSDYITSLVDTLTGTYNVRDGNITIIKEVEDVSLGIIDKIFDPYVTSKKDGTGIGLYMTKVIIEKNMEGRLKVFDIDDGAEFVMELKLVEEVK